MLGFPDLQTLLDKKVQELFAEPGAGLAWHRAPWKRELADDQDDEVVWLRKFDRSPVPMRLRRVLSRDGRGRKRYVALAELVAAEDPKGRDGHKKKR